MKKTVSIGPLRKKKCIKILRIFYLENDIFIFTKNVAMRMEEVFLIIAV